jgi:hypothetical protein
VDASSRPPLPVKTRLDVGLLLKFEQISGHKWKTAMRLKRLIQIFAKGLIGHDTVRFRKRDVRYWAAISESGLILPWRVDLSLDAAVQPMGTTHSQPVL